jgi:hypothetical protein
MIWRAIECFLVFHVLFRVYRMNEGLDGFAILVKHAEQCHTIRFVLECLFYLAEIVLAYLVVIINETAIFALGSGSEVIAFLSYRLLSVINIG